MLGSHEGGKWVEQQWGTSSQSRPLRGFHELIYGKWVALQEGLHIVVPFCVCKLASVRLARFSPTSPGTHFLLHPNPQGSHPPKLAPDPVPTWLLIQSLTEEATVPATFALKRQILWITLLNILKLPTVSSRFQSRIYNAFQSYQFLHPPLSP